MSLQRKIEEQLGVPEAGPQAFTFYVTGSKDRMHEIAEELGLSKSATEAFIYTGYEVEIRARVDRESGRVVATGLNGKSFFRDEDVIGGIPV